ncbi:alpha/beta fold hydrolase [Pseudoxanthomonas winnipegensis]|uniref:alpha/beta fold hydrolase n=1 Tax=Pseudoxanthomonas winnipegensis TaxID=2480810 RepID=UPI00102D7E57|nr:alpha/beta fold hydrolase [Pseudoxanthomonas winnipegensis]TAA40509.1 alpha/beta fold hydrolase [Pseudoxanthomonas winnipegensis]
MRGTPFFGGLIEQLKSTRKAHRTFPIEESAMLKVCRFPVLALCLGAALSAAAGVPAARSVTPRFEPGACPATVARDERIDCGVLIVAENRQARQTRPIRLPVMIFRSTAAAPAPDPVVYLPGGPGLSSVEGRVSGKGNPFLAERDQILLEGRGNLYAQPSLACPELNTLRASAAASAAQTAAAARCRAALSAAGIDLDGYTYAQTADDLEDLRQLLGIAQWNLIGYSSGTRLVQTVLARHPQGVRSAILDSVLPIDIHYDEMATAALQRALDLVFDGCSSEPACATRYPRLRERFASLVAQADRQGIAGPDGQALRGREVVDALASALQQPAKIPTLPRLISEAADGHPRALLALRDQTPSRFNWGLRLSIWCSEEMPFESPQRMAAQVSPALGLGGFDARTTTPETCAAWHVAAADADANAPVRSEVPTLILAGEFDPVTPPAWGRRLLRTLPYARFVMVPGQAHGAMFNRCGGQLTLAFLHDPSAALDLDCIAKSPGLSFATD